MLLATQCRQCRVSHLLFSPQQEVCVSHQAKPGWLWSLMGVSKGVSEQGSKRSKNTRSVESEGSNSERKPEGSGSRVVGSESERSSEKSGEKSSSREFNRKWFRAPDAAAAAKQLKNGEIEGGVDQTVAAAAVFWNEQRGLQAAIYFGVKTRRQLSEQMSGHPNWPFSILGGIKWSSPSVNVI